MFDLRNGIELTTVFTTLGSSRIQPVGEKTVPFAYFGYEKNFENYIINTLSLPIKDKVVKTVTLSSLDKGYDIIIYGIYI